MPKAHRTRPTTPLACYSPDVPQAIEDRASYLMSAVREEWQSLRSSEAFAKLEPWEREIHDMIGIDVQGLEGMLAIQLSHICGKLAKTRRRMEEKKGT